MQKHDSMPGEACDADAVRVLQPWRPERGIAVWLKLSAAGRPRHMNAVLDELARPEFVLGHCREYAAVGGDDVPYRGYWYAWFEPRGDGVGAEPKLLERLRARGCQVLRVKSEGVVRHAPDVPDAAHARRGSPHLRSGAAARIR